MSSDIDQIVVKGYDDYDVRLGDELRGERATLGKSLLDVQRDLRIRAAYIAAIENCDPAVFPNQGFIAGYVRSYARYLGLDAEAVFARFCDESGFHGVNAGMQVKKSAAGQIVSTVSQKPSIDDPLMRPVYKPAAELTPGFFERMSISAIGSLIVLTLLTAGVGYGGYRVLQTVQRVTIAPVEQRPETLSDIADFTAPGLGVEEVALTTGSAAPVASDSDLTRLYQPRELTIPVVDARDGPIVEIDPQRAGLYANDLRAEEDDVPIDTLVAMAVAEKPVVREQVGPPTVNVVARQPAWVRVYQSDGTVLFEKILEIGEIYSLPPDADAPLLRAGNSGSVYLLVDSVAYGPLGNSASVVKDVSLIPDEISGAWPEVTDPPEVIQATVSTLVLDTAQE
ncbi:MAG: RodZ domain-containing protein [Pseudomonadota bacterium]